MALQLVDIFGNLQPDTGKTTEILSDKFVYTYFILYKKYKYQSSQRLWQYFTKVKKITFSDKPNLSSWNDYSTSLKNSVNESVAKGIATKINDNSFKLVYGDSKDIIRKIGTVSRVITFNNLYIQDNYIDSTGGTYSNFYIDIEETDIFKRTVGDKLDCLYQIGKLKYGSGEKILETLSDQFFTLYFKIQTFYPNNVNKSNWESLLTEGEQFGKDFINEHIDEVKKNVQSGIWKKEDVPSCFLPDPDPALPGPPTQTISGVTNKAPTVDNPNIKLPSQEVKSLTATSATDAVGQAQTQATSLTNQAQGAVSSVTGQAQGAINNLTPQVGPAIKVDGLGNDWTPDKFQPSSIAGNTKYVDPKTGVIGSTSTLAKGLTGAVAGGALGAGIGSLTGGGTGALAGGIGGAVAGTGLAIGGVTGGALAGAGLGAGIASIAGGNTATIVGAGVGGATLGAAAAKLNGIKSTMPKPKIPKPPNTPRIKTVKIPRPNSTKGAETLLNLPKTPTF